MLRALFILLCWPLLACACSEAVRVGVAREALTGAPGASSLSELPLSAAAPLYLEVWARVHGSASGPLERDMPLYAGDRIGLSARTSSNAQVLLLYCDHNAMLSVYPSGGALSFEADQRVQLPAAGMDIQLGPDAGPESLYVLASRRPLAQADPRLDAALLGAATAAASCGPALETLLGGAALARPGRATLRGVDVSDSYRSVARAFAAEDGVVILGFAFEHLAR
jgi:hypothetical protein